MRTVLSVVTRLPSCRRVLVCVMVATAVCAPHLTSSANRQTPPPSTSADAARQSKSNSIQPYRPGWLEGLLINMERNRWVERLFDPLNGAHPWIGGITEGSGLGLGVGYRRTNLFGQGLDLRVRGATSLRRYRIGEVQIAAANLFGGRAFVTGHVTTTDFPGALYFGAGLDSRRDDRSAFAVQNTAIGRTVGARPSRWLTIAANVEALSPTVSNGHRRRAQPIRGLSTKRMHHKKWEAPVCVYFRRADTAWVTIGIERPVGATDSSLHAF